MPKTNQPGSARKGYLKDKTNKEWKQVKQMKKDAANKHKTVERLMGSRKLSDIALGTYIWIKDSDLGKKANQAEHSLQKRRRVRFGDRSR